MERCSHENDDVTILITIQHTTQTSKHGFIDSNRGESPYTSQNLKMFMSNHNTKLFVLL